MPDDSCGLMKRGGRILVKKPNKSEERASKYLKDIRISRSNMRMSFGWRHRDLAVQMANTINRNNPDEIKALNEGVAIIAVLDKEVA